MNSDINANDIETLSMLWDQTLAEDAVAFKKIHEILFDGLYLYAIKLLRDESLANDLVQDLFIKIWMKRESIGPIIKVKSYFFTALRRQILNHLRDLRLHALKIKVVHQVDIEFSHEEIVIKKEEHNYIQAKVLKELNNLPKRQKEVIYLHYFESLDYAQIADIMNINYQSVLNFKQKAMQKLRSTEIFIWFLYLVIHK